MAETCLFFPPFSNFLIIVDSVNQIKAETMALYLKIIITGQKFAATRTK